MSERRFRLSCTPWFQWRELAPGWNWRNFDFVHLGVEQGTYKGWYFELTLVLLGLGVTLVLYNKASRESALVPLEELREDWLKRNRNGEPNDPGTGTARD